MSISRPFKQFLNKRRLHSTTSVNYIDNIQTDLQPTTSKESHIDTVHTPINSQNSTPFDTFEIELPSYRYSYNIILVGDSNVGKSCLKDSYMEREFNSCQPSTLVIDFKTAYTNLEGDNLAINLWDAAGHPSFKMFARSYYKKCCAILLVFSFTNKASFESLKDWLDFAKKESPAVVFVLVGNKADAKDRGEVTSEEAREFAQLNDLYYYETTCTKGSTVENMFQNTVKQLYNISTKSKDENLQKYGIKLGTQTQA